MAIITAFVSEKGGVGKSTDASNMGVQRAKKGKRVVMLDLDPQGTLKKWADRRELAGHQPAEKCFAIPASKLQATLERLDGEYDDIIMDTGGADSTEMRLALMLSDVIVAPCQPSQADIETLENINKLLEKTLAERPEVRVGILISKAPTHVSSTAAQDMRDFCANFKNLPLLNTILCERQPFRDALLYGQGVVELAVNKLTLKAICEAEALEKEIWNE
jgi:chromosome partitioning protein